MTKTITIEAKTLIDLCAAAESARAWMSTQAPCTPWANRVRQQLHNAIQAGVQQPDLSAALVLGEVDLGLND